MLFIEDCILLKSWDKYSSLTNHYFTKTDKAMLIIDLDIVLDAFILQMKF